MNRAKAKEISTRIKELLSAEYPELQVHVPSASFDGPTLTVKVEFAERNSEGTALTDEYRALVGLKNWLGLTEDMLKELRTPKGPVKLTGYNSRAKRYPVEFINIGSGLKFKTEQFTLRSWIKYHTETT